MAEKRTLRRAERAVRRGTVISRAKTLTGADALHGGPSFRFWRNALIAFLVGCFAMLTVMGGMARAEEASSPQSRAATEGTIGRVADASTANLGDFILLGDEWGGRYTGRVWTDKSVYTGAAELDGNSVPNDSDFLTVYSALGSTRVVNGQATTPIDVVLMLDVSTSMSGATQNSGPIAELTREANNLIDRLMTMNSQNRVAVVTYGGGSYTVMPLDHYKADGTVNIGGSRVPAYLRLQQQWGNSKYYNSLKSTATGDRSGKLNRTQPYFFADSTYLQGALFEGTNILVTEPTTTYLDDSGQEQGRIPAIIVLSDGGTNIVGATSTGKASAGSLSWDKPFVGTIPRDGGNYWAVPNGNPLYASVSSNTLNYNEAIAPRTLAVLLGAGRQKMLVEDHYGMSMRGYSIGFNINGLGRNEQEQLYGTLDPANYFNATSTAPSTAPDKGSAYAQNRLAYETYLKYQQGQSPTLRWTLNGKWLNTKLSGTWTYNHPATFDPVSLDDLYYIDQFYNVDSGGLGGIFDDIYSQLGGIAFHPVSSGGDAGAESGISYSDPIGDYMEVKEFKGVSLFGKMYQVIDNGDGTYRVADESGNSDVTVRNPNYVNDTYFKLSDIKISVEQGSAVEGSDAGAYQVNQQVVKALIPESVLPLRKETIDLDASLDSTGHQKVKSYSTNKDSTDADPLRIYYTVGVSDTIKTNGQIDLAKVSKEYLDRHTNADGSVDFYSNLYTGVQDPENPKRTVGDAASVFSPGSSNRFYYFQKNRVVYQTGTEGIIGQGGAASDPVTGSIDPFGEYYVVVDYYGPNASAASGYAFTELSVKRSGTELLGSVAYIDAPSGNYADGAVTEYDAPADGRVLATKRGGVRPARINTFAMEKADGGLGETETATLVYLPEYANLSEGIERIHVALGNNGRLRVSMPVKDVTTVEDPSTTINGQTVTVGSTLRYQVEWTNATGAAVEDLRITDWAPAGTAYAAAAEGALAGNPEGSVYAADGTPVADSVSVTSGPAQDADGTAVENALIWTAARVEPGQTVRVSFQVTVTDEAVSIIENQALMAVGPNAPTVTNRVENPKPVKDVTTVEDPTTSIDGQTVGVGSVLRYEVEWANTAGTVASEVRISDAAPAGTEYVLGENGEPVTSGAVVALPGAGSDPSDAPVVREVAAELVDGTLVWNVGEVQPGEAVRVSFQVRVTDESVTKIDNQATMAVGPNEYLTNWVHNPKPVKDVSFADEPTTSINGQTVGVGSVLRYKVEWTNETGKVAEEVRVADAAPEGTAYVLDAENGNRPVSSGEVVSAAGETVRDGIFATLGDDGRLIWNVGTVQPGETVRATFDVTVTGETVTKVDNQASLLIGPNEYLTNWVHNPIPKPEKDVTTVEDPSTTINGQSVTVGSTLRYQVEWTNEAETVAEQVVITDAAPAGTAYAGAGEEGVVPGRPEGVVVAADGSERGVDIAHQDIDGVDSIVWNAGDLQPGETVRVSFQVTVTDESVSVVENQASMQVGANRPILTNKVSNPVPDPVKDVTTVEDPSTSIDGQTVRVGDVLRYEVSWTNTTGVPAEQVVITDAAPSGTAYVAAAVEGGLAGNPEGAVYDGETALPDSVSIAAGSATADDGSTVETRVWTAPVVQTGQSVRVSFQVVITDEAVSRIDNEASMTVGNGSPIVTNKVRNPIPDPVKDVYYAEEPTISIDGQTVGVGSTLQYLVEWTNTTGLEASDVRVVDAAPAGTTYQLGEDGAPVSTGEVVFVSNNPGDVTPGMVAGGIKATLGDDGKLTWNIGTVPADATVRVTFNVTVTQDAVDIVNVDNQASLFVGENEHLTNWVHNTVPQPVKDVTTVEDPSTSIDGQIVSVGSVLRYDVSWTNDTDTVAEQVVITDAAPAGTTLVYDADGRPAITGEVVAPSSGEADVTPMLRPTDVSVAEDGTIAWNAGDVQPGESVRVSFQVTITDESVTLVENEATMQVGSNRPIVTNKVRNPIPKPVKDVSYADEPTTSINGQTVGVGSVLQYFVEWTNTTGVDADDVRVVDAAPEGTTYQLGEDGVPVSTGEVLYISSDPGDVTPGMIAGGITATLGDDGRLTWNIGEAAGAVPAGATVRVTFNVVVTADTVQNIDNQASLFVGENEHLTNWVHNTVPTPVKDVTTVEDPSTSIDGQTVHVGDVLRYEVSWTNASDLVAEDVSVSDAAPTGTAYVLAEDGAPVSDGGIYDAEGNLVDGSGARAQLGDDGRLRWTLGDVQPGQSVRVSFQVRVSGESVSVIDNQATMTVGRNDHNTNWVHNPVEVVEGSDAVILQLEKTLRGRPMEDGEFGFVATDMATGEQMTALVPAAPDGTPTVVSFKPIVYTSGSSMAEAELQPDGSLVKRFVYEISEVNGGVDGVLYDPAVFYAFVTVTDDQRGTVTAEGPAYFYDADGTQPVEGLPSFTNRYSEGLPFVPSAYKTTEATEGHDPSGLSFGFVVTDNNGGANQGQIVATGTSPANGPATFSTIEYFEPGTYNYVMRELRGGTGGSIVYDGATYGLQVVVESGESGLYVASATYTDAQGNPLGGEPTFHNVYDGDIVALDLNLAKRLNDDQGNGLALTPGEFGFVITDADTGEDVGVGYNDAYGNVALSTLIYSYRTVEEPAEEKPAPGEESTEPSETPNPEQPDAGETPANPDSPVEGENPGEGTTPEPEQPEAPSEPEQPGDGNEGGATEPEVPGDEGGEGNEGGATEPEVPAEPEGPAENPDEPADEPAASEPEAPVAEEGTADGEASVQSMDAGDPEGVSAPSLLDLIAPAEAIADGEGAEPYTSTYLEGADGAEPAAEPVVEPVVDVPVADAPSTDGETAVAPEATEPDAAEPAAPTLKVESPDLGEHHYIVREILPPDAVQNLDGSWTLNGVRFDLDRYYITVTVSDEGNGTMSAAVTAIEVWENGDPANARPITVGEGNPLEYVVFENAYTPEDPLRVTPEGTKTLTGRDAVAGEFDFVVRDAQGTICSVGKTVLDAANGEASPILFSSFKVPAVAGTYEYTVSELRGNDASITYSGQLFRIVVTVAPDEKGTLRATVEYADGPAAFTNTFTPKPVAVTVSGTKTLTGKDLAAGEFTFRLVDAATGEAVATTTNTAEGSVAFEALQLSQPGVYEYRVEEVAGNEQGVSYDTASYRAVVTVEAAADGSLTAHVEYPDGYPSFKNTYTPPVTPPDNPPVTPPDKPVTPGPTPGNPGGTPPTPGKPSGMVPTTGDETLGTGVVAGIAVAGAALVGAGALVWSRRRHQG